MSKIDRRSFVVSLGGSLGMMGLAPLNSHGEESAANQDISLSGRKPNVIIMICDDIGSGDPGCCGSKLNTPNLDRMASEGARLTRFNTAHPLCSAARGAVLTGRYSTRTGTIPVYFPNSTDGLNLDESTLANLLHAQHYRSMCIGKWHLGSLPQYLPTSRGFDSYFGVPWSVDMHPLPLFKDKTIIELNTDRNFLTPRYTEAAVRFIESSASSSDPFFLYVAYSYPHIPIHASPRFKGKSQQGIYGDAVEEIDWSAGEIFKALRRNHLDENTLVIFTGDHGPWFQGSPGALRGRKGTPYEGGCRVPFIARWKNAIPAGQVVDGWGSNLDIVPTVASICGADLPSKPVDGVDISDLFTGRRTSIERDTLLYFSALRGGFDLQCARKGSWKLRISQYTNQTYVLNGRPGENLLLAKPELYNLDDDPEESYDVADSNPDIVRQIQQRIDELIPTFPEKVVDVYKQLLKNPANPHTPAGAAAIKPRPKARRHKPPKRPSWPRGLAPMGGPSR